MLRMITREEIPCWYELSWSPTPVPAIIVRIHKDFIQNEPLAHDALLGTENFRSDFSKDWGVNGCCKLIGDKDGFTEYVLSLPRVHVKTGKLCRNCDGQGYDDLLDRQCLYCNGRKEEWTYDHEKAFELCTSLMVLTDHLSLGPEKETTCPHEQLMIVNTHTTQTSHGSPMSGAFSRTTALWMLTRGNSPIPEMAEAMKIGWQQMMVPADDFDYREISASLNHNNGSLHVNCPGNACGLNPHYMGISVGYGYRFSDHNVDIPAQQLTLLAGLAALHDLIRKELG
jgi:hypothetical protein